MIDYLENTLKVDGSFDYLEEEDTLLFVTPDPEYRGFICGIKHPKIHYGKEKRAHVMYTKEDLLYAVIINGKHVFVEYKDSLDWVNAVLHKNKELEKEGQEVFFFDDFSFTLAQMREMHRTLWSAIKESPGMSTEGWIGWQMLRPFFPAKNFACEVSHQRGAYLGKTEDGCAFCPCLFKDEKPCADYCKTAEDASTMLEAWA